MRPGIHTEITAADYRADICETPSLSASIAHILTSEEGSPADAYLAHPKLGGQVRKTTGSMDRGTLMHALLLGEPDSIGVIDCSHPKTGDPVTDYRTTIAKMCRADVRKQGKAPVLLGEWQEAKLLAGAINEKLLAKGLDLSTGHREVTLVWDERADDGTPVRCRGRVDHLVDTRLSDIKTADKVSPGAVQRKIIQFGYHVQQAAYVSALENLIPNAAGRVSFDFWFFQTESPYKVQQAYFEGTMRELGAALWRRAVNTWARCLRTGEWPDGTETPLSVPAPIWALRNELGIDAAEL